jgi:putative ABC transport system permease protein
VVKVRTMQDNVSASITEPRFRTTLLGIFALLALLIASVGIYGVMAFSVIQRTREIGVRLALGSSPARIFRLVVGDGMKLAFVGVIVGVCASLILTRYLRSLLFQVGAYDPVTMMTVTVLLVAVAFTACYLPARRAMRVQVADVLRQD